MNYKSVLKTPSVILNPWVMPGLKNNHEIVFRNTNPDLKEKIVTSVITHYGVDKDAVFESKCRKREIVVARQLIMTFFKKYTKMSLKSIGQEFCGERPGKRKDHTTVIHSIQTVKDLCDTDDNFSREVKYIECMFL